MDRRLDFDKIYGIKEGRLCVGGECWDEEKQAFESHGSGVTWVFDWDQRDFLKGGIGRTGVCELLWRGLRIE
jgi:hypothetical protein